MMAISDRGLGTVTTSTNPDYLCSAQIMRYTPRWMADIYVKQRERHTHTLRETDRSQIITINLVKYDYLVDIKSSMH